MQIPTADEILASDLDVTALSANMFRVRADKNVGNVVVFDFGYLPPILQNEMDTLAPGVCRVHTRIAVPFNLAKSIAQALVSAIENAETNE
jgi:hypothetical protein